MVLFRLSAYKNFKHFWRYGMKKEWPKGHTSMGWLFGFKLHLHINHQGQTMALKL